MNINPYLNFAGNTEEAFNFYKSVFGGEFTMLQRFKDTPDADKLPPGVANMVMHVSLPIGKDNILMGTDAPEQMGFSLTTGNNFYICIGPDSREEATRLFNGLSAGGKIEMELQDMFWGAYYGSLTDKFGIKWMINYQKRQ
ncbi:VOC family protein [Panacibacter ginsenosidivorans]|uniref:VOC family protein n=1 Tax=Panacibacter ginsenosidivorans TaxID=1813871 RepID=A0A5B8V6X8_9BACT|nr:VOC family protein [Panacibacter ginsenosidivorans]QEC66511.1 VOC family protein [Panacibacter ginsenosidivorans]